MRALRFIIEITVLAVLFRFVPPSWTDSFYCGSNNSWLIAIDAATELGIYIPSSPSEVLLHQTDEYQRQTPSKMLPSPEAIAIGLNCKGGAKLPCVDLG
jgi:hypothetical protein